MFTAIYRFKPEDKTCSPGFCSWLPTALVQGPDGLYGTEQYDGGSFFKITCPSCGGGSNSKPPTTPPAAAPPGAIEAVDPNNGDLRSLIPALSGPLTIPGDPSFQASSYDVLAKSEHKITGLAADGVTQVLLRWHVTQPGKVTFTLAPADSGPIEQVGALGCIEDKGCAPWAGGIGYDVTPAQFGENNYMAFALLQAPIDFVRPNARQDGILPNRLIKVTGKQAVASGTPPEQNISLSLARPPVVLLHGVWSDRCTWKWPIQQDVRFVIYAQDYSGTNADHFIANLDKPLAGIQTALGGLRQKGYAVTQVDFVGHSMGGLLGRMYAGDYAAGGVAPLIPFQRGKSANG